MSGTPPFDVGDTPAQYRALLGAWGPGVWQGGDKAILIVEKVGDDGNVQGIIGRSDGGWYPYLTPMSGNQFTVRIEYSRITGAMGSPTQHMVEAREQFELRSDGKLYGSRNGSASTIVLSRLQ
jgi:hypothetical protein